MALRLPDPMLTRPAELPLGPGSAYEVKWDGFRALVSALGGLRVRSRRGWDMTERVQELAGLPEGLVLDGEPSLSTTAGRASPASRTAFSTATTASRSPTSSSTCLSFDGDSTMTLPYTERRAILDRLGLEGAGCCTPEVFDDGERLFAAVVKQRLEGIVAKPLGSTYRPAERDWLKVKNRTYWRFGQELGVRPGRRRVFV